MMRSPDAARLVVGWDIGGAHVKAALCAQGRVRAVVQRPCPLWQGLEHLDRALDDVLRVREFDVVARHAVTMTGEMADCFDDRREGVSAIATRVHQRLGASTRFFAGAANWCTADEARDQWHLIASANWLAMATLVAACCPDAVVVDVGSTTTDLVPIVAGRVAARGSDDASRLASRELVYHGVARTPLAALAQRVGFGGRELNVMNEWFATAADVYRLTGELAAEHDQHPAADGGDKSERATCARIARMIGHDAAAAPTAEWRAFAHTWRALQLREIERNLRDVIASAGVSQHAVIIGAGCGDFLARDLASRAGRRYVAFDALIDADDACAPWARVCAPSAAVAALFDRENQRVDRQARRQPRD